MLDRLELPKFELESEFPLTRAMNQLGVTDLFNIAAANFTGMVSPTSMWAKGGLYVGLIRYKVTIEVDEAGTVATSVIMMAGFGGMPQRLPEFVADRPFLFLILDEKTFASFSRVPIRLFLPTIYKVLL